MKIVCLGNYFSTGGAQMDMVLMAEKFREQGHEAEAWFFARAGDLDTGDVPSRIFADKTSKNPLVMIRMLASFFKACRDFKPDAIIGFFPFSNVAGGLANIFGVTERFVATQRNPSDNQSPFFYHAEKLLGSTAAYDANICITQSVADSFAAYPETYKKRIKIVYNGVPPMPTTSSTQEDCKTHFGLPQDSPVIGTLGRLHKQKNIAFIVRCMQDLPDHFLAIAGDGPQREMLEDLVSDLGIEDRVKFVGTVSGEDVTQFYTAMDIFAMPSIFEGFGRTLVEAFEVGKPVICSDLSVLEEVSGGAAITLPLEEAAWVEAFQKMKSGEIDTAELADKGRARAKAFTLDAMVNGYLDAAAKS